MHNDLIYIFIVVLAVLFMFKFFGVLVPLIVFDTGSERCRSRIRYRVLKVIASLLSILK
ncbi:hypothetical protein D3C87_1620140 [compost metagenome]